MRFFRQAHFLPILSSDSYMPTVGIFGGGLGSEWAFCLVSGHAAIYAASFLS